MCRSLNSSISRVTLISPRSKLLVSTSNFRNFHSFALSIPPISLFIHILPSIIGRVWTWEAANPHIDFLSVSRMKLFDMSRKIRLEMEVTGAWVGKKG